MMSLPAQQVLAEHARQAVGSWFWGDDRIAGVTGQPTEWVAPRGSL